MVINNWNRRKRLVSNGENMRLTLRDLAARFLEEKRRLRGLQTAGDYRSRLTPVLDFAEATENLKRLAVALNIDAEFVRSLRAFLFQHTSTRNGKPGAKQKSLSSRQIVNILECLQDAASLGQECSGSPVAGGWIMPVTNELIGMASAKNPSARGQAALGTASPDRGCNGSLASCVSSEFRWSCRCVQTRLQVSLFGDVNFEKGWLQFGEQFKDANFTKGRTAFMSPFPPELRPILTACIGGRAEGPLLRSRRAFERRMSVETVPSLAHLVQLFDAELIGQPPGIIQAEQDRKLLFRSLLRRLGGVTEDAMNREFKKLLVAVGVNNGATLYTLRSSVTTAMHCAGLPHLEMRYLTGHSTNDILNVYTSLDPVGVMGRYFETARPLLDAIKRRSTELRLV